MQARLVLISLALTVLLCTVQAIEGDQLRDIFEKDSEFMRGFETGVLMRSKKAKIEDYGCTIPDLKMGDDINKVFKTIDAAFKTAKIITDLASEPSVSHVVELIEGFLSHLPKLLLIMLTASPDEIDMYCRGMVFGLRGSQMLVGIANTMLKDFTVEELRKDIKGEGGIS